MLLIGFFKSYSVLLIPYVHTGPLCKKVNLFTKGSSALIITSVFSSIEDSILFKIIYGSPFLAG